MSTTISETICENVSNLIKEAKNKYEERNNMTKYAREIETELAFEEITVRSVDPFEFAHAFGEQKQKRKNSIKSAHPNNEKNSKELILEFLNSKPDQTATSADITKYFHELGRSTPAPTLTLMVKNKLIENVSRGVYRIVKSPVA